MEFNKNNLVNGSATPKPKKKRIGQYEIEKTIGKGNFAVVKLASHVITNTKVAIKIINKTQLDPENLKKVTREVQIMKLLDHPNIIKLYEVMTTPQLLYIVTEFAENGEMFEYLLNKGRMSEVDACTAFTSIVEAVDYCHKRSIVHRDLKAENLLLDENNNVKIADFGFSNHFTKDSFLRTWCGSPPYAAPELFQGKEYVGPEVDVWSLGVVLYVMVCGVLPFQGKDIPELRNRVLAGRFRIPFFMSGECENLIRRMLVLDTSKRIQLDKVLSHSWLRRHESGYDYSILRHLPVTPSRMQCSSRPIPGVHGRESQFVWNDQVLECMSRMGYNQEKVRESVSQQKYDPDAGTYYLLIDYFQKIGTKSKFAQLTKRRNSDILYHIKDPQAMDRGILNRNSIALGNLEEMNQRHASTQLQQEERSVDEDKHTLSPQNMPEISFHSIPSTPSPTCSESKSGQDPFLLNVTPSSIPQHLVNRRHTLGPLSFGEDLSSSEERAFHPHDMAHFVHVPHLITGHSSQENTYYALADFTAKDKCGQLSSPHSSSCTPTSSPQPHLCYAQVKERRVSDTGYLKGKKIRTSEGQNANTLKRSHDEYTNLYTMEKSKFPKQSSKQHKGVFSKLVNVSQHKFSRNSATYPVQEDPDEQSILVSESEVSTPVSDPPGEMTPTLGNLSANSLLCRSPDPPILTTSMPPNILRRRNSRPRSIASNYDNYSLPPNLHCSSLPHTSQGHEQLQERLKDIHINHIPIHKALTPQCTTSESACIRSLPANGTHPATHHVTDYPRANSDDLQLSSSSNTTSAILSKCHNNNNNQYPYMHTHALSGAELETHGIMQQNGLLVHRTLIQLHNSLSLNNADFPHAAPANSSLIPQAFYIAPGMNTTVLRQPVATPALDETIQIPHMTTVNTQNRQFFT